MHNRRISCGGASCPPHAQKSGRNCWPKPSRSIDALLDWTDQTPRPNLTQIENAVLKMRKRLGEQAAQAVIEAQDTHRPVPGPGCPTCQREMHYKDTKAQTVESRVGHLRSREGTTIARPVTRVFFPLDEQLELWEHHWSESVAKYAVWLSGLVTYAEAATILNTIGEIPISASSIWRRVAVWGPNAKPSKRRSGRPVWRPRRARS